MLFPHSKPNRRTNEDVFFAFYPRLLEWAVQITRNNRTEAEDLVQDFYLRVTRIARPIDEMEHLEHYLFRVLRSLYYSRLRRAGRDPLNDLSIVDYDSVEQGLAAADRRELLFVRDHLRQVCRYACERKSDVRSASVLILRFFLGYYPTEVMKILQAGRSSVDKLLQVARNEARLFLERPEAIRCISPAGKPPVSARVRGESTQQLFTDLQAAIFSAAEGKCFDQAALEQRYAEGSEQRGLTTQELSHLVSCQSCLDRVNVILQLPLLANRSPEDGIDRDGSSGPGGEGGSGITGVRKRSSKNGPSIRKLERHARQLFEHRPHSLEIVVDGEVRTSQKITAEINELQLKLAHKEEPAFIEILSEQGFCLAFLLVAQPVSADKLQQVESALFSDDRSIALTLSFAGEGPIVHVLYRDPVMAEEATTEESNVELPVDCPVADEVQSIIGKTLKPILSHRRYRFYDWTGNLIVRVTDHLRTLFVRNMNPMLATAMLCAVAAIVFFCLSLRNSSLMKAGDLIQKATTSENALAQSGVSGVVVQRVRIQTPRRKVERTLYRDVQRKRRLKDRMLGPQDASLRTELEAFGISWNDPLSAGSYRDWHDHASVARDVVKRPEKGLLTLTTTLTTGRIARESLTVRASDFHPVERTVELRDAGTVEIAELNYSVLPWSSVNPDLFESVFDAAPVPGRNLHATVLPHLPRSLSPAEIDEAELGARLVLNRLHLDANSRIELTRQPVGVHVQGIVEDDEAKRQLGEQLSMVPHVSASILTIQEVAARPNAASDVTSIQQSSVAAAEPSALERYFAQQGMDRTAAGTPVWEFEDSSFAIKHESGQITDLLNRFSSERALSSAARTTLTELLIQHKAALLDALGREDRQLIALRLVPHSASAGQDIQGTPDALRQITERNFTLCAELISESHASSRPAQEIASQLATSIAQLRAVVLHISAAAQMYPPSSANAATANQNK